MDLRYGSSAGRWSGGGETTRERLDPEKRLGFALCFHHRCAKRIMREKDHSCPLTENGPDIGSLLFHVLVYGGERFSGFRTFPPLGSLRAQEEPLLGQFPSQFGFKSCATPFEQRILEDHTTGTEQALHPQGGFAVASFDQDGAARR
jgi:hypothetical protein